MNRTAPQLTLLEAARIVARGGDLDAELAALAEHARGATGASAALVYLLDPVANRLVPAAGAGIDDAALAGAASLDVATSAELAARVVSERRALTADGQSPAGLLELLAPAPQGVIGLPL
ncbi:MAG TPA: hypothetical protein VH741_12120, partial [Candidatus Limnocylindrales bacterium]